MFYDENDNLDQTHIKIEFEPFPYLCSIFRVIIFAQNLASHVGGIEFNSIESFADISFMLGEDFLLCQDKI